MADLVGDVPARRGGGRVPSGLGQPGHQRAGDRRLGGEVGGQRGHVGGHVTALAGFEYREDLAGADLLPRLGPEFGQHAVGGRADGLLHLHRLQHQDRLARGDHRAGFGQHPQDQAGHRGQQRPGGRQLGRIAEPRGLGQRGRAVAGVDVGVGADVVDPVDPPGAVDLQVDPVRAGREDERLQGDAVDLGVDAVRRGSGR